MRSLLLLTLSFFFAAGAAAQSPDRSGELEDRGDLELVYYDYVENGVLTGGVAWIPRERDHVGPGPHKSLASGSAVTTLVSNGSSDNRIDLVFVGDGYTASELATFAAHVDNVWPAFLNEPPLDVYSTFFNIHRVDVISNESGVDHDPQGTLRDTALDMGYWCGGIARLLCVNVSAALGEAANAPDVDQVLAVANSNTYGGAGYPGSDLGTLAGGNSLAIGLALHEFGHSAADLADEYDYGGPTTWTGGEPGEKNVSTHDSASMAANQTKWHLWLSEPNVGTFEGAKYSQFGIYRPTSNSMMRSLGRPFEQVNSERFVVQFYQVVRPIDDATAAGQYPLNASFYVDPVDPVGHVLEVQWSLDGVPIPGATAVTFDAGSLGLSSGVYTLAVEVRDPTDLVRDETARDAWMTETRSWVITDGTPPPPVLLSAEPFHASDPASILLTGDHLDTVNSVTIDGIPAAILSQTQTDLTLQPQPGDPGFHTVTITSPGGSDDGPVEAWPTLTASTTGLGGTLDLELDVGAPAAHILGMSRAALPGPFPILNPPTDYGLLLDPSARFTYLSVNLLQGFPPIQLTYNVPTNPNLAGVELYFQAWTQAGALDPDYSFTNLTSVTM